MYVVCVRVQVLAERTAQLRDQRNRASSSGAEVRQFVEATLENARATRREPGNVRFDVLRATDDPARFFLYEVYRDEKGFRDHQQTPHYLAWKERVAPFMAVPRVGEKHVSIFPDPWS